MVRRTATALLSWIVLIAWAFAPPAESSRMPAWVFAAIVPLHLSAAAVLYARARAAPADPAWPAGLRLLMRRRRQPHLRALSLGGRLFPVVVISGDWNAAPADVRRALLAHEAAHLVGWHMLWMPALWLALLAVLPDGYGSYLLALAISATINRRLEYAADERAARRASPEACRAMLQTVGEDRHWSRLAMWPIFCILLTHPPLAERLAALDQHRI